MSSFLLHRKLSFSEILLIPEVLVFLLIFRFKVSYQTSQKWMPKVALEGSKTINSGSKEKAKLIAKVVNGLSKRTPWKSTCLVKVLAARYILNKRQIENKIHIGVDRSLKQKIGAHAWLSIGDEVILGGGNLEGFHEISGFR